MVVWLWLCCLADGGQCRGTYVVFPQARLVEIKRSSAAGHPRANQGGCVATGHLLDKAAEVDGGVVICTVRNGTYRGKWDAIVVTHLSDCRTLHFHGQRQG